MASSLSAPVILGRRNAGLPAAGRGRSAAARRLATPVSASDNKPVLYDMPVSNNGAKVRLVIYKKGLEDVIDKGKPADLGGLKSEEYLKLNPMGKMPMLSLPGGGSIPESQVIIDYILDKYHGKGPSLMPSTPEARAKAALIPRVLDTYIGTYQGAMYRGPMEAAVRADQIGKINDGLDYLEQLITGPYVAGKELSVGDTSIFPTFVFMVFMLPTYFGWESVFKGRPKLEAWWSLMLQDPDAKRVHGELIGALNVWAESGRWETTGISDQVLDKSHQWAY